MEDDAGLFNVGAADVEMRDGADELRADRQHQETLRFQPGDEIGGGPQPRVDLEDDNVGVDLWRIEFESVDFAYRGGQQPRVFVIFSEPLNMMIERIEGRRGDHA